MERSEWEKVNKIVDTALDLEKKQRQTYINKQCKGDNKLKRQVTELIASIEASDTEGFLEGPGAFPNKLAGDLAMSADPEYASSLIGQTVGNYEITDLIDHGGMGSVFMGQRADDAYKKKVAIKVLRRGMDTPSNIARFKRERSILAKLDHPNIARLLDGGLTENGLPYLVMEYVEGTPLLEHCNNNQLSVSERLQLFEEVCFAVQYAHQNAIIHRDLKPSNIMVNKESKVKVLDFGIAKLMEPSNTETMEFKTRTGARMLTLGYAAPEQLESKAITTATDSYVLGIVLYELLAGAHPFDMADKGFTEIEKMVRKQQPVAPSERYADLTNKQQSIADNRDTTPTALINTIKGDLDAIVMKALRKEPGRRYSSAEQLLEDLNRRKINLPIIAREDTFRYNASKFIKRHKTGLSVAAGFLLLLIGFTAFYTWQIAQERNKAQLEAQKAQEVSNFLTDMFRASNPNYNPKDTVTATTFLKRGQERIDQLEGQPEVQAQLLEVLGRANTEIGHFKRAKPLLKKSLQLRKKHVSDPELASGLDALAVLNRLTGNFAKAESLNHQALEIIQAEHGQNTRKAANTLNELGLVLNQQGKYQQADSIYKRAARLQKSVLDSTDTQLAHILNNRAGVLKKLGKLKKAETLYRRSLSIWETIYDKVHPTLAMGYGDLGMILNMQRKFDLADSWYQKSLALDKQIYEGANRHSATLYNNLGILHAQQGELNESETYFKKSLQMRRDIFRGTHPQITQSLTNLGQLYLKTNRPDKALPLFKDALKNDKANFGDTHPYVASDYYTLGLLNKKKGLYSQTTKYLQQSLDIYQKTLPADHPKKAEALLELGDTFQLQSKYQKAKPLLQDALEIRKKKFESGDIRIAQAQIPLGTTLMQIGHYQQAEELLKKGYKTIRDEQGLNHNATQKAKQNLVELYETWGKPDMAKRYSSPK